LLVCAITLATACTAERRPPGRAFLIGIDGASARVIDPMLQAGRLPNLGRIAAAGVYGSIRSFPRLRSPRIWTTVATGKTPEKHGIQGWVKPAGYGRVELYYGRDRIGPALWNIASDAGLRVAVVNWLVTYPPEIVNGVVVSDHTFPKEIDGKIWLAQGVADHFGVDLAPVKRGTTRGPVVSPSARTTKVLAPAHREARLTDVVDPFAANPTLGIHQQLSRHFHRDGQLVSIALQIEEETRPDLTMILLQGIDRASHYLWAGIEAPEAYEDPPFDPERRQAARVALETYYTYTDALIGRLLGSVAPEDLVIVLSDHGFEADHDGVVTGNHKSPRAEMGVIFARGPGIAHEAEPDETTVNDITPTVLAWLGLPIADDMDGRVAPFLAVARPKTLPTYDDVSIRRLTELDSGAEQAILEELRALGYVE
jgi:predicted AlkP superfamily phosphohydrolase/phosphomutase